MSFLTYRVAFLVAFLELQTIIWELAYQVRFEVIPFHFIARDLEFDAFGTFEKVCQTHGSWKVGSPRLM